jgi:hypothetical protein
VIAFHRILALSLGLLLIGGNSVVCGSLAPTPEARMACCSESGNCPMHHREPQHSGSGRSLTQAQADACCTLSEHDRANQPIPTFAASIGSAVLGSGIVVPASVSSLVIRDGWRTTTPIAIGVDVPRYVLLSVFLV